LENLLSKKDDPYVILKHKVSDDDAKKISESDINGIILEKESWRYYPEGDLLSHVLGFVNFEGQGQYGVEEFFEDKLEGSSTLEKLEKDVFGNPVIPSDLERAEPQNGADIYLTINRDIQYEVEKILEETVTKHGSPSGSAIVMDPKTGAILAMASYPDFDPNSYSEAASKNPEIFKNSCISSVWEPGSIFKVITMAAGLETGKVKPETILEDKGSYQVGSHTIRNADLKAHGKVTLTRALELSLNVIAAQVSELIGKQSFYEFIENFGFGKLTGIELAGEVKGIIRPFNEWADVDFATASFGQGIGVTPIQMITAVSSIANGGKLVQPHIVEKIVYPDGRVDKFDQPEGKKVISTSTANSLTAMMVSVVENGHGQQAKVKGYRIAGKTGTAQVAKPGGGYDPNKTIGSFVLFAPADDPKFVVLVRVDYPKGVQWAESTAAPAAGKIAAWLLRYWQIPPS